MHTFKHDWEAQSFTLLSCFLGAFHQALGARHDGYSSLLGKITGN
jgi:hypothetical protein